jgi:hypothetical protein
MNFVDLSLHTKFQP